MGKAPLEDNEAMKQRLKDDGRWAEFQELRKKNLDERGLLPNKIKREIWRKMGYDGFGNKIGEQVNGLPEGSGEDKRIPAPQGIPEEVYVENINDAIGSSSIDDVQWIYLNLSAKEDRSFTQPPPNGGAKALLRLIQANGSLMTEFARNLFRKMESEREQRKGFNDDGREILEKIDMLLSQFKERDVL